MKNPKTLLLQAANAVFLRFRFSNTFMYVPFPVLKKRHFRSALASFFVYVFLLSCPVQAAHFSADYLLKICSINESGGEVVPGGHAACQSYIAGVLDYHSLIQSLGTSPSVDFCVPESTSLNELQAVIVTYLRKNYHEQGPFIAAPGVALGLYQAYPCK